jgi:pimeloyl-ACP methyl ester carboxylesterase
MKLTDAQRQKLSALSAYAIRAVPSTLRQSIVSDGSAAVVEESAVEAIPSPSRRYSAEDMKRVEQSVKTTRAQIDRLFFWMGPQYSDLRQLRPYFLIPIGDAALPGEREVVCQRIADYAVANGEFTDLYVLSHGWHRNLFSGVAAYDRLMSRFSVLMQRGRLHQVPSAAPGKDFKPLFVAFHWHSDPGDDRWTDKSGRRDKESFLKKYLEVFEPGPSLSDGDFLKNAEDQFEFMTKISSPDLDSMDQSLDGEAARLTEVLDGVQIRFCSSVGGSATPPSLAEKVSMLWRCYFESVNKAVLDDQSESPKPIGSPLNAFNSLAKFVIGVVGIGAVVGMVNLRPLGRLARDAWTRVLDLWPNGLGNQIWAKAATGAALYLACALVLGLIFYLYTRIVKLNVDAKGSKLHGLRPLVAVLWLVPQVLWTLPVLVGLLTSFIFRTNLALLSVVPWIVTGEYWWSLAALAPFAVYSLVMSMLKVPVPGLYDERAHKRWAGDSWRDALAGLARVPIRWLREIMAPDSKPMVLGEALDSQFAFFEMQQKGACVGAEAGDVLASIVPRLGPRVNIHLVGHSFGGLVVCNAAKNYLDANSTRRVHSLNLVQAAIASNWFRGEDPMLRSVDGAVSCIYSAYDTANGFYYPMANNGRLAAGYVGLCQVGSRPDAPPVGQKSQFAMLVRPPALGSIGAPQAPCTLNLDASRLIYEGSVAVGGGHDDIFKDDVVNLIWAASRWGLTITPPSPPPAVTATKKARP